MIKKNKIDWNNSKEVKKYKQEYFKQNKDKIKIQKKNYREQNKEKIKIQKKNYSVQNKKDISIRNKKYIEGNKDKIKIQKKGYYQKNKDKTKLYQKLNKDKIKDRIKKYNEQNKERIKIRNKKYRQKSKSKIKAYYQKSKDRIKEYQERNKKSKCIICGKPAPIKFCSKKCMGIWITGDRNSNWQGGKSFEPYPLTWTKRFKRQIRERDAYLCMMCNRHQDEFNKSNDIHHIDGDKMNTIEENCISLCARHHSIVERGGKKYTFWMPKFQKMLNKLYGYSYN